MDAAGGPSLITLSTGAAAVGLASALVVTYLLSRKKEGPFPPGPKQRFLIGNALDIPFDKQCLKYREWSKQFNSNIIHLYALGNRMMVLHSRDDAEELLEKRAAIYSDRPIFPMREMIGWHHNFATFSHDEYWRKHRRVSQEHFKASSVHQYFPVQIKKTHEMLVGLLDSPERFEEHNKMLSISVPLVTLYGYEVKSLDDPVILAADRSVELGTKLFSPGGSFANVVPIFRFVPWTWTRKIANEVKRLTEDVKRIPLEALLKDMKQGNAIPSLVGNFMERKQTVGATAEDEEVILNVANTAYAGGADTTVAATGIFIYLLAKHPEVQIKAQKELDRVLGSPPRLPTFEDVPSLPYIEAIYREVLRWYPPVFMGVPHVVTEDDWYKGFFIPKGTMVFANIWAMNRDEAYYAEPDKFNPDRFFDADGKLNKDDKSLAYGFGRRACVGKHLARTTLWLTMASVLACFNVRKKKDANGNEIDIDDEFQEEGIIGHKTSFECDITPRSNVWRDLIEATRNEGYNF